MKFIIALCFVIAIVGINGHSVQLSEAQKEKATKHAEECIKETGVDPQLVAEVKKGNFVVDENLKKFSLCFFQKAGIVDHEGNLNIETALAKLPEGIDKAEAQKLLETCKSKTGKDAADKAFEILKCYKQGTKIHISPFE